MELACPLDSKTSSAAVTTANSLTSIPISDSMQKQFPLSIRFTSLTLGGTVVHHQFITNVQWTVNQCPLKHTHTFIYIYIIYIYIYIYIYMRARTKEG